MITQALNFKTVRDHFLTNILSAILVVAIVFFPYSPLRIILGLPFILFFPGYVLICALFPRKEDLDWIERLALSLGLSIAVTSLMGLALNYTSFGIRLYSVTFSLFSFMLLTSAVAIYRRRTFTKKDAFAPLASISISGWRERVKSEFIKSCDVNRIIKIITIIAFIFIILALIIIAKTTPASDYEISIYDAYPTYFWFFIIASIFIGQIVILRSALSSDKNDKLWLIGFPKSELYDLIKKEGLNSYEYEEIIIPDTRYLHADEVTNIGYYHTRSWKLRMYSRVPLKVRNFIKEKVEQISPDLHHKLEKRITEMRSKDR